MAYSRSIDKPETIFSDHDRVFDGISGSSGYLWDDRFFLIQDGIQEGWFPDIRLSNDGNGDSILYYISNGERLD